MAAYEWTKTQTAKKDVLHWGLFRGKTYEKEIESKFIIYMWIFITHKAILRKSFIVIQTRIYCLVKTF